ncbi:integrase [Salmonella enterica subsp. enterica serovar Mbandaka str. ATCC 51958]|nr:integrase [Salmonella enterica subsp. enterica serovar Mbandaka str. ATCC 51958]EBF8299836.1 integrase [Salmonella enterica subsp. enterica serovar Mbandaka]
MGYSQYTVERMNSVWRNLIPYIEARNSGYFSIALARQFVEEHYGLCLGDRDASHNVHRAIHILSDFQRFGIVFQRSRVTLKSFSHQYAGIFESFLIHLSRLGFTKNSIKTWRSRLFRLEYFLKNQGVEEFCLINLGHINQYIETLAGFSSSTVASSLLILKRLSNYAHENGYHTHSFAHAIPVIRRHRKQKLPSVYTVAETEKILSVIDRQNAIGKRNYAIFLLLTKTGLRISDVRAIKFDNIDWSKKTISIIQQKSRRPLDLPLLEDIGWAIIDYLRHGRPQSDCQNIFIKHVAPFDALTSAMHKPMIGYLSKAGIVTPTGKSRGVHSLRHSLATTLMEQRVPIQIISQTLGHINTDSTEEYIRVDLPLLRQCALEVE